MLPPQSVDEALFWLGQQEKEHLYFLTIGLEESPMRQEALRLYRAYDAAAAAGDADALLGLAPPSQDLKRRAYDATLARWTGFWQPAFYKHCVDEVDRALKRIAFKVPPRDLAQGWALERSEVASMVAKSLDAPETAAAAEATQRGAALRGLAAAAKRPSSGDVAPNVYAAVSGLNGFLDALSSRKPRWNLHPLLLAHELREGKRAEGELVRLSLAGPAG